MSSELLPSSSPTSTTSLLRARSSDDTESFNAGSIEAFTIHLGDGELHSVAIRHAGNKTLRKILETLSYRRGDPSLASKTPVDPTGRPVDLDTPITELGVKKVALVANLDAPKSPLREPESTPRSSNPTTLESLFHIVRLAKAAIKLETCELYGRMFHNCFRASQLVAFIKSSRLVPENQAIEICIALEGLRLIHHVCYRANFANHDFLFYRFTNDDLYQTCFWNEGASLVQYEDIPPQNYALSTYLPNLVVRFLSSLKGAITFPHVEDMEACVLFADISGFTALTESLVSQGPSGIEKLTQHLNNFFRKMIAVILAYGGDVVKFAGDALIVVWPSGSRAGLRFSTMMGCQCALELIEKLKTFDAGGVQLTLHIGISVGTLKCLVLGTPQRAEIVVCGTPLTDAAVCEGLAKPGEVVISTIAQKLIGSDCCSVSWLGQAPAPCLLESISHPLPGYSISLPLKRSFIDLLPLFVPRAVSNHLLTIGQDTLLSQLRSVTILFIQIPLISASERDFIDELQDSFATISEIVLEYEGIIRQLIIDDKGTVCIVGFGLPPTSHEDDPHRAVLSALRITDALNRRLGSKPSIGITMGKVFCGAVGAESRREYAMVGSAVNMSARLMGKAEGRILVDQRVYLTTKKRFSYKILPPVVVKGRTEPLDVFSPVAETTSLMGITSRRMQFAGERRKNQKTISSLRLQTSLRAEPTRIIGRDAEIAEIARAVSQLKEGSPQRILAIKGEDGSGKSLLAEEIMRQCSQNELRFFSTHGYSSDAAIPFGCIRGVVTYALKEILSAANVELSPETEDSMMRNLITAAVTPELASSIDLLSDIVPSLNLDPDAASEIEEDVAEARANKIIELAVHILVHKSNIDVFIFEDVQWMDSMSWRTLTRLAAELQAKKMIALTLRPMDHPGTRIYQALTSNKDAIVIRLVKLSANQIKELIADVAKVKSPSCVSDKLAALVHELSGGNPFLATECVRSRLSSHSIVVSDGRCDLQKENDFSSASFDGERKIASLLLSKFDALSAEGQMVIKIAAVSGRHFSSKMIADIARQMRPDFSQNGELDKILDNLIELGFLVPRDGHNHSFMFRSPIQREAIYSVMLIEQKKQLHKQIAQWIEQHSQIPDQAQLAYHYKGAEDWSAAIAYLRLCAAQSMRQGAFRETISACTDCLETAKHLGTAVSTVDLALWNRCIGFAHFNLRSFNNALDYLGRAITLLNRVHPEKGEAQVSHLIERLETHLNTSSKRFSVRDNGLYLWRVGSRREVSDMKHSGAVEAIMAYTTYSIIQIYCNNPLRAAFSALTGLKDAAKMNLAGEYLSLAGVTSMCLGTLGKHDLGSSLLQHCHQVELQLKKENDFFSLQSLSDFYYASGFFQSSQGLWDRAKVNIQKSLDICEAQARAPAVAEALTSRLMVLFWRGNWSTLDIRAEEAIAYAAKQDSRLLPFVARALRIAMYLLQSRVKRALEEWETLSRLVHQLGDGELRRLVESVGVQPLEVALTVRDNNIQKLKEKFLKLLEALERLQSSNPHSAMSYLFLFESMIVLKQRNEIEPSTIDRAYASVRDYASRYPFVKCIFMSNEAEMLFLQGNKAAATDKWTETLRIAKIPFVEGYCLLRLDNIEQANRIFTSLEMKLGRSSVLTGFESNDDIRRPS